MYREMTAGSKRIHAIQAKKKMVLFINLLGKGWTKEISGGGDLHLMGSCLSLLRKHGNTL